MTAPKEAESRIAKRRRIFSLKRRVEKCAWTVALPALAFLRAAAQNRPCGDGRILVLQRILRIGDTLVARPALQALRQRWPGAPLAVVCAPALAPLCRADRLVDEVIVASRGWWRRARRWRPDATYVFVTDRWSSLAAAFTGAPVTAGYDYVGRGLPLRLRRPTPAGVNTPVFLYPPGARRIRAADIWVQLVAPGHPPVTAYPPLDVGAEAQAAAQAWLRNAGLGDSPFVICHSRAANPAYNWYPERWADLARRLHGQGLSPVWTGAAADAEAVAQLAARAGVGSVAAGRLSLLATCALAARAVMVISVDTALIHVAATMGTPVVGLYGPGDEEMWAPLGVPHRVLTATAPCRGCKQATCFQPRHFCMEGIETADVMTAAEALLQERKG